MSGGTRHSRSWTPEEDRALAEAPDAPASAVAGRLGRGANAVAGRRAEMAAVAAGRAPPALDDGLAGRDTWGPGDVEFLRANYRLPLAEAARQLGRSTSSVQAKKGELGLTRIPSGGPWRDEEIEYIRDNTPAMGIGRLATALGRSEHAVRRKLAELGTGMRLEDFRWSAEDVEFLRRNRDMPSDWIGARLGRGAAAVRAARSKHGAQRHRAARPWTAEEDAALASGAGMPRGQRLRSFPGRSAGSVLSRWRAVAQMVACQLEEPWYGDRPLPGEAWEKRAGGGVTYFPGRGTGAGGGDDALPGLAEARRAERSFRRAAARLIAEGRITYDRARGEYAAAPERAGAAGRHTCVPRP